jgi:hypothetical protein
MSYNEAEIIGARLEIAGAAQAMLAGELSYIEGSRKLLAAIKAAKLDWRDPDLLAFAGIDSETGELPIGPQEAFWPKADLPRLRSKLVEMEVWARDFGERHCQSLVERFARGEINTTPMPY